jgi:drug/metabolite transporter (DMT)-like permease
LEHDIENTTPLFQRSIPYFQLFIAIIAVSFSAIIVVLLLDRKVPSEVTAMYRTLFAGIGALLLSIPKKKISWITKKTTLKKLHWIILAGVLLAIHFATWFISLEYVSVAISTTLVDTVPIFLAIFGFVFFREKVSVFGIIGIAIAFVGGTLLAFASNVPHISQYIVSNINENLLSFVQHNGSETQLGSILGIIFSLVGAITVSFYFLIGKKMLQDSPLWPYFALVNLTSFLSLLIYCLIMGYKLFSYTAIAYLLLLVAALGPSLIGHATYNYSLRKLPAFVVGVAILGEPVGATILGVIILGQKPDLITILYAGLILLGIILTSISQNLKIDLFKKRKEKEKN